MKVDVGTTGQLMDSSGRRWPCIVTYAQRPVETSGPPVNIFIFSRFPDDVDRPGYNGHVEDVPVSFDLRTSNVGRFVPDGYA